jgi:hypothetical protein
VISVPNGQSGQNGPKDDVLNRVCFGTTVDKLISYISDVRAVSAVATLGERLLMKECGKKRTKVLHPACEGKARSGAGNLIVSQRGVFYI